MPQTPSPPPGLLVGRELETVVYACLGFGDGRPAAALDRHIEALMGLLEVAGDALRGCAAVPESVEQIGAASALAQLRAAFPEKWGS